MCDHILFGIRVLSIYPVTSISVTRDSKQSINQSINIQLYPVVISKTCFSLSKSTILYVNTAYAALYGVLLCKCSIIVILYKAPLFLEYSMPTPIL